MNNLFDVLFSYALPILGFLIGFLLMRVRTFASRIAYLESQMQGAKDTQQLAPINDQLQKAEQNVDIAKKAYDGSLDGSKPPSSN